MVNMNRTQTIEQLGNVRRKLDDCVHERLAELRQMAVELAENMTHYHVSEINAQMSSITRAVHALSKAADKLDEVNTMFIETENIPVWRLAAYQSIPTILNRVEKVYYANYLLNGERHHNDDGSNVHYDRDHRWN